MPNDAMTLRRLRHAMVERLTPVTDAREAASMADMILEEKLGVKRIDLAINPDRIVTDDTVDAIDRIVTRVVDGEPVQYVLGVAWFHGLRLYVAPGVLIPRPETSQLVDIIAGDAGDKSDLNIIDVCTGSGAIAAALGRALRFPRITAVDISPAALDMARRNFAMLNTKVDVIGMDVLKSPLPDGPFDIVVSNPPYVAENERTGMERRVLDHEPDIALFVPDSDPTIFYRRIASEALGRMASGGRLYFEINPKYADDTVDTVRRAGFVDVDCRIDYIGRKRFVTATRP